LVPSAFSRGLWWPRSETDYVTQTCAEDWNVPETLLQSHMCIHSTVLYSAQGQIYVWFRRSVSSSASSYGFYFECKLNS
jgi:hypothetical protein